MTQQNNHPDGCSHASGKRRWEVAPGSPVLDPADRPNATRMVLVYVGLWMVGVQMFLWAGNVFTPRRIVESLVYPALVMAVMALPSVRHLWIRAGKASRWAAAAIIMLLINAQLLSKADISYPLNVWNMYGDKVPIPLHYYDIVAVHGDGSRQTLDVGRIVAVPRPFLRLLIRAQEREKGVKELDPAYSAQMNPHNIELLRSLAGRYELKHPGVRLARVDLVRIHLGNQGERLREEVMQSVEMNPPLEFSR